MRGKHVHMRGKSIHIGVMRVFSLRKRGNTGVNGADDGGLVIVVMVIIINIKIKRFIPHLFPNFPPGIPKGVLRGFPERIN